MIGVQEVMAGRYRPGGNGREWPPVERLGLGPAEPDAADRDRPVRTHRNAHAGQPAHRLEPGNLCAKRLGRVEQNRVADLRILAEEREGGIAPGPVGPARIDMHARSRD